MWTAVNQTYATPGAKNAWAHLAANNQGWRRIKPDTTSGVTNVHLMLVAAKAVNKQANVVTNASNEITAVYF